MLKKILKRKAPTPQKKPATKPAVKKAETPKPPAKKPERVQTAEGWTRMMRRNLKKKPSSK